MKLFFSQRIGCLTLLLLLLAHCQSQNKEINPLPSSQQSAVFVEGGPASLPIDDRRVVNLTVDLRRLPGLQSSQWRNSETVKVTPKQISSLDTTNVTPKLVQNPRAQLMPNTAEPLQDRIMLRIRALPQRRHETELIDPQVFPLLFLRDDRGNDVKEINISDQNSFFRIAPQTANNDPHVVLIEVFQSQTHHVISSALYTIEGQSENVLESEVPPVAIDIASHLAFQLAKNHVMNSAINANIGFAIVENKQRIQPVVDAAVDQAFHTFDRLISSPIDANTAQFDQLALPEIDLFAIVTSLAASAIIVTLEKQALSDPNANSSAPIQFKKEIASGRAEITLQLNQLLALDNAPILQQEIEFENNYFKAINAGDYEGTILADPNQLSGPFVIALTSTSPSPTAAETVIFELLFSQPVTGVDSTDFSIDGLTGSTVSTVAANASGGYSITITTGATNGILNLMLVDDNSIADSNGQVLVSTVSENGSYRSADAIIIKKTAPTPTPTPTVVTLTTFTRGNCPQSILQHRLVNCQLVAETSQATSLQWEVAPATTCSSLSVDQFGQISGTTTQEDGSLCKLEVIATPVNGVASTLTVDFQIVPQWLAASLPKSDSALLNFVDIDNNGADDVIFIDADANKIEIKWLSSRGEQLATNVFDTNGGSPKFIKHGSNTHMLLTNATVKKTDLYLNRDGTQLVQYPSIDYTGCTTPVALDLNADGYLDIYYFCTPTSRLHVYYGGDIATYDANSILLNGTFPTYGFQVDDFNGDGAIDFAFFETAAKVKVHILYSGLTKVFATTQEISLANTVRLISADFTGDGVADVAVFAATEINILAKGGGTKLVMASTVNDFVELGALMNADLTNDGIEDFAFMDTNALLVRTYVCSGSGCLSQAAIDYTDQAGSTNFSISDLNGDGSLDVVISRMHGTGDNYVYINDGNASLTPVHAPTSVFSGGTSYSANTMNTSLFASAAPGTNGVTIQGRAVDIVDNNTILSAALSLTDCTKGWASALLPSSLHGGQMPQFYCNQWSTAAIQIATWTADANYNVQSQSLPTSIDSYQFSDLDHNGVNEFVTLSAANKNIRIYHDFDFTVAVKTIATNGGYDWLNLHDLNQDGYDDFILIDRNSGAINFIYNNTY